MVQIEGAYLGRLVFGGGDEVGAVGRELEVVDLVVELVGLDVLQLVTGLHWVVSLPVKIPITQSRE